MNLDVVLLELEVLAIDGNTAATFRGKRCNTIRCSFIVQLLVDRSQLVKRAGNQSKAAYIVLPVLLALLSAVNGLDQASTRGLYEV